MNQARAINRFEYMAQVFPDVGVLRDLSEDASRPLWDFMCFAVFVDDTCSDWEATAIQRIGMMMPNLPQDYRKVEPNAELKKAKSSARTQRKLMSELATRIGGEAQREAAFKMLCILSTIDELDLEEIDFIDAAAQALGLDKDMGEHILRSSWETCRAHYYAA